MCVALALAAGAAALTAVPAAGNHSWGGYHWARTANPFTLKVVDSVTSAWDSHLDTAIADWSRSSVLDLVKETGATGDRDRKRCKAISGKIRVCNATYGFNGWLGLAQIWVSGSHITAGVSKMNDSYFNTSTYNKPEWRQMVICQEPGHNLGLDHQDENFSNPNLGTCMDYTANPKGPPSNEHPNAHDYEELETIYAHPDSFNSYTTSPVTTKGKGKARRVKDSLWVEDLGNGQKLLTWILWTSPRAVHGPPFEEEG